MKKVIGRILGVAAAVAFGLTMAPAAHAVAITHNFSGTFVSQTGFTNPAINFGGATITGSYTFQLLANCGSDTACTYTDVLDSISGTVTYGGGSFSFTFSATDGNITIRNDNPVTAPNLEDFYEVRAGGGDGVSDSGLDPYNLVAFNLNMREVGLAPTGLSSTSLLLTAPYFGTPEIAMTFQCPSTTACFGTANKLVFSFDWTEVPEPGSLALLGLGLLGLGLTRRKAA